jgi:hypothetical protein
MGQIAGIAKAVYKKSEKWEKNLIL